MKKLVLIPLVLVLGACGVSSSDGVVSHSANTGGLLGLSTTDAVTVEGASALAEVQNVVIGSFKVGFAESSKKKNKARGSFLGGGMGGNAVGNVRLEGVSDQLKQQITDAAYNDFVTKLEKSGFKVVDRTTLTASSEYADAPKKEFPLVADDSGFMSSYGKTTFFQPSSLGNTGMVFANDLPGGGGFGAAFGNADSKMANFATATKVAVVSATYLVDFAAAGGHESAMSASVKVGQNIAVTQGNVKFVKGHTSSFSNGTPTVSLGQPIQSGEAFGTVVDETSGGDVAVQEAANVVTALLGGGTNRSRDYTIQADPAKYQSLSSQVLSQTNDALLSKAGSQ